jgi:uncharacterized protein HemX
MMDAIYATLTALGSGAVAWIFSRKQTLAQVKSQEIDNAMKNAQYYQELLDDMTRRYKEVLGDLETATKTIKEQDAQIHELMASVQLLTDELKKYKQLNGKS